MGPLGSVGTDISYAETISGDENEEIKVDPTGKGAGFSAVLYDNTNGLPTSEANAIAETREGFLWIGSYSGLIRYDGSKFERIDSTTGITSVVSLYVDSKDRLWIGTNDNGVGVMEKGQIRMLENSEGLTSRSIRSFTSVSSSGITSGSSSRNLYPCTGSMWAWMKPGSWAWAGICSCTG